MKIIHSKNNRVEIFLWIYEEIILRWRLLEIHLWILEEGELDSLSAKFRLNESNWSTTAEDVQEGTRSRKSNKLIGFIYGMV